MVLSWTLRTGPGLGSRLGASLDIKLGDRLKIILLHSTPCLGIYSQITSKATPEDVH